jgi:hypothetical protein
MIGGITLIYGVGLNDLDRTITRKVGDKRVSCPIYAAWHHMLERCYSEKWHNKYPTYTSCSVVKDWLRLSSFERWMLTQDWQGKQLDKDFLYPDNKLYSPDTCVFIDQRLNKFLTDRSALRGAHPLGVCKHKDGGFVAACWDPFKGIKEYLGIFKTQMKRI